MASVRESKGMPRVVQGGAQGTAAREGPSVALCIPQFVQELARSFLSISSTARPCPLTPLPASLLSTALRLNQHSRHRAATASRGRSQLARLKLAHASSCCTAAALLSAKERESNLCSRECSPASQLLPCCWANPAIPLPRFCHRKKKEIRFFSCLCCKDYMLRMSVC